MKRLNRTIRKVLVSVNLYQTGIPMVVVSALVFLGALGYAFFWYDRQSKSVMELIEQQLDERSRGYGINVEEVRALVEIYEGGEVLQGLMDRYRGINSDLESILLLDDRGKLIFSSPEDPQALGVDHTGFDYYREVKEDGTLFWSDVTISRYSRQPMVTVSKRFGDRILVLRIDLLELSRYLSHFDITENSLVAVTDSKGTYLAHSDFDYVYTRRHDYLVAGEERGNPTLLMNGGLLMLGRTAVLSGVDWGILYYLAVRDVMRPWLALLGLGLLPLCGISVLSLFKTTMVSYRLTGEVEKLVRWTRESDVDRTRSINEEPTFWELKELAGSFSRMTERLQIANENLENQVRDRTAALEKANEELQTTVANLHLTQASLIESEKMASLGQLVAGVAHELNTPIGVSVTGATFLQTQCKLLKNHLNESEPRCFDREVEKRIGKIDETSKLIIRNMERASGLITSFKKVAIDHQRTEFRSTDIRQVVEATLMSLSIEMKNRGVTWHVSYRGDLIMVTDPGAVSQVITNLIQNSLVHAFSDIDDPKINLECSGDEAGVNITYRDNGTGIEPNNLKKIFDPFFTTARNSGGTGLGLHIVYNLVTSLLKGAVISEIPREGGALFRIAIPR